MTIVRTIRVGVIGLGQIAIKAHLPGYNKTKGCKITAVYSLRGEHARKTALQYGIPRIYENWKKLLESRDLDAVSICTPNFTHLPITLKAIKEGKHVLVEKPMALSSHEAIQMIQTAKKHKRILMVHHNMRFDPVVRTAEKLLRQKTIGEVFAFKSSLTHRGPEAWRPRATWFYKIKESGGGALMDLGPHHFDCLRYMLNDEAKVLASQAAWNRKPVKDFGEIHCACLLKFKRGAFGTLNVGWADTSYQNRFYFFGTKGTLYVNLAKGEPLTLAFRDRENHIHPSLSKDSFTPTIYEHFIYCARNLKTPLIPGEAGLKTIELIEAGYRFLNQKHQSPK